MRVIRGSSASSVTDIDLELTIFVIIVSDPRLVLRSLTVSVATPSRTQPRATGVTNPPEPRRISVVQMFRPCLHDAVVSLTMAVKILLGQLGSS